MRFRQPEAPSQPFADLVFRFAPNWTAVGFFGCLGLLHLVNGATSLLNTRWEGSFSVGLAVCFTTIAILFLKTRTEIAVLPAIRCVQIRWRVGWLRWE